MQLKDIKVNNLQFKSVEYRSCMNRLYAFVTCIDTMQTGKGTAEKKYWGEIDIRDDPGGIEYIIGYGSKFENIP